MLGLALLNLRPRVSRNKRAGAVDGSRAAAAACGLPPRQGQWRLTWPAACLSKASGGDWRPAAIDWFLRCNFNRETHTAHPLVRATHKGRERGAHYGLERCRGVAPSRVRVCECSEGERTTVPHVEGSQRARVETSSHSHMTLG